MSGRSDDLKDVGKALETLARAHSTFRAHDHPAYRIRAANELALGHLRQAINGENPTLHLKQAAAYATEVGKAGGARWKCNSLIVWSRIHRALGEVEQANEKAQAAIELAGREEIRFCLIDARIALGESHYAKNTEEGYRCAIEAFGEALSQGGTTQKENAVLNLHLALCYIGLRRIGAATRCFLKVGSLQGWNRERVCRSPLRQSQDGPLLGGIRFCDPRAGKRS